MAQKVKTASLYFLILILAGLMIGFNVYINWANRVMADDVTTSVTIANTAPTMQGVSVYGTGVTTVALIEDTAIDIMASANITDINGCTDIRDGGGVEAIFYTSDLNWTYGTGATCSLDYNNCITGAVTSCSYSSCTGNTASYDCVASGAWYYYADSSIGTTSSKANEAWEVMVWASDSAWVDISSTSFEPTASNQAEISLLSALALETGSQSTPYNNSAADSDSTVLERGMRNSGNRGINPQIIQTTVLTSGANTINAQSQQFAANNFTIGVSGTSLSASNQELNLELPQRTDPAGPTVASISDDQIFWGLHAPTGKAAGSYTGANTYTAVED